MDSLRALAPVLVHLASMGICAHDRLDLGCNDTQLIRIGAHDTKVDQVTRKGAEDELRDAHARLRRQPFRDLFA